MKARKSQSVPENVKDLFVIVSTMFGVYTGVEREKDELGQPVGEPVATFKYVRLREGQLFTLQSSAEKRAMILNREFGCYAMARRVGDMRDRAWAPVIREVVISVSGDRSVGIPDHQMTVKDFNLDLGVFAVNTWEKVVKDTRRRLQNAFSAIMGDEPTHIFFVGWDDEKIPALKDRE